MDSSLRALQTNGKFFFNFILVFEILAENIFKTIARREYWSNWIRIDKLYKLMKSFFKFRIHLKNKF